MTGPYRAEQPGDFAYVMDKDGWEVVAFRGEIVEALDAAQAFAGILNTAPAGASLAECLELMAQGKSLAHAKGAGE